MAVQLEAGREGKEHEVREAMRQAKQACKVRGRDAGWETKVCSGPHTDHRTPNPGTAFIYTIQTKTLLFVDE